MKNFKRRNLPEYVTYKGEKYVYLCGKHVDKSTYEGKKVVQVNVMSRNLEGKTDLHGQPYKPSQFIFVREEDK